MLRRAIRTSILVLIVLSCCPTIALAQWSKSELQAELKKLDDRVVGAYERTLSKRDIFASLHDAVWHGAYKDMKAQRETYAKERAKVDKTIAANDIETAMKQYDEVEAAGRQLEAKVSEYAGSSAASVTKIQIGLGVFAFAIGGIVVWLVKRRRQ